MLAPFGTRRRPGSPRNRPADGVHGLLGHDGVPEVLLERGRCEVRRYGEQVVPGGIVGAALDAHRFIVKLGR